MPSSPACPSTCIAPSLAAFRDQTLTLWCELSTPLSSLVDCCRCSPRHVYHTPHPRPPFSMRDCRWTTAARLILQAPLVLSQIFPDELPRHPASWDYL